MSKESARAHAAYEIYAAMGPARSLSKLIRQMSTTDPDEAPEISTVKFWSRTHRWQDRVEVFDSKVAEKVEAGAVDREAERRLDVLDTVETFIVEVRRSLDQYAQRKTPVDWQTPQDIRAAGSTLAELVKTRELILGKATSRVELMSNEEIEAELAEYNARHDAEVIAKYLEDQEAATRH